MLAGCLLQSQAIASTESPPADTVDSFHRALLQVMQHTDFDKRQIIADQAVTDHFSTNTIARISLGSRHWRALDQQTQSDLTGQMQRLIATTYAARFDAFNRQRFEILSHEPISEDRHRVRSQLITQSETVSLDYQLQRQDGTWRIYDVAANGVSDLSLKRSVYARLFRDGGLEAVITNIRQEIAENEPAPAQ